MKVARATRKLGEMPRRHRGEDGDAAEVLDRGEALDEHAV